MVVMPDQIPTYTTGELTKGARVQYSMWIYAPQMHVHTWCAHEGYRGCEKLAHFATVTIESRFYSCDGSGLALRSTALKKH